MNLSKFTPSINVFVRALLGSLYIVFLSTLACSSSGFADSRLTKAEFSKIPDKARLNSSQIIIRNSLLGVVKFNLKSLEKLSRPVITDNISRNIDEIYLGSGKIYISRGLAAESDAREVQTSVSMKNSEQNQYLRLRFTKHRKAGRIFEITYDYRTKTARLRHITLRALAQKSCALNHAASDYSSEINTANTVSPRTSAASLRKFTVATDCDRECYLALGQSRANDRIAEFFNSARTYYQNDLAFDLVINSQTVRTSSSTYNTDLTEPLPLLERFLNVSSSLPGADLKHLITAKEIREDVVGLSYLSVVCKIPDYSIGFSQHFNSLLTPIIIAHEIGHNFGADHDPKPGQGEQGLMTAVLVAPYPLGFSALSKSMINSHINSLGGSACFESDDAGSSPPANTYDGKLSAKFSRNKVSTSISQPNGTNCILELHAAGKESKLFSTSSLVSSINLGSSTSIKLISGNMKKVLLANSSKRAKSYLAVKSMCSEGTGYSNTVALNVGIVKSSKTNKNNTVRGVKEWISLLKTNLEN